MVAGDANDQRIVVVWDGSSEAAAAFPVAGILARQLGVGTEIRHFSAESTAQEFEAAVSSVALDGLEGTPVHVALAEPGAGILKTVEDPDVALVVLTTHGFEARGLSVSKVTERVIAETRKPVLIVRPEASAPPREFKRLLLPVDGTPRTAAALRPATELAKFLGASIDLLHVAAAEPRASEERGTIRAPRYVDQPHHEWPAWAAEAIERLANLCAGCPPEVPVRMFLDHGDVGAAIHRFVEEHQMDAIVLVRRSRLQRGRALTLRAVLADATCPILICSASREQSHQR